MADIGLNCVPVYPDNPSIEKNMALCTSCGHCLAVCREEIGVAAHMTAGERFACVHCGQCVAACPEGALRVRDSLQAVRQAVQDPEKVVVVSTAPAVRVGLAECFGEPAGTFAEGRMVQALRALGVNYVLDVAFAADLTILEEGTELLKRLLSGKGTLPQFTSCCPAWVKYIETFHPERIPNLSSAKSPIGMQGALIKTYFAGQMGLDPEQIVTVTVAPCSAKKFEITREEQGSVGALLGIPTLRDNDYVLTTNELAHWIQEEKIPFRDLEPSPFDSLMGESSGAGLIFGNTGGVMEAALRMAYSSVTGKAPAELLLSYQPVRGMEQIKEAVVQLGEREVRVAIIYGTRAAEQLIQNGQIDSFDFVEVMTCPGGCISGAGQPSGKVVPVPDQVRERRIGALYRADQTRSIRSSLDNPEIKQIYDKFLDHPLSPQAERLLHTAYHDRSESH